MNKYIKIGLSIAVVAALGIAGVKTIKNAKLKDASTPKAKMYPLIVKTISPKIAHAKLTLPYLAEVKNDKDVTLSSRISARIIGIKPSGVAVKKGDIIAKLDTTSIKSKLSSVQNQIKANLIGLENLKLTHKRTQELLKIQGASIEDSQKEISIIASKEAKIAGLKLQEIELKNNLSYAVITSPVDGVIAKSMQNNGSISMPGKPLAKISSKNGFYLMVRVPKDINIKGVEFQNKLYNATTLESTFNGLSEYKIYTNNLKLTSGDKVEVDVIIYNDDGVLIPFDAVLNRNGKSFVLLVSGNKAIPKEVHILSSAQQGVIISDTFLNKSIVIAKPDILLKLTSGYALKVKG